MDNKLAFNFGKNWQAYSQKSLTAEKLQAAVNDLADLIPQRIENKTFLDIGCGSGIHGLAASTLKAKQVVGIDISPESIQASIHNKSKFAPNSHITFQTASLFEYPQTQTFDIVYSWGVLHHTGRMFESLKVATNFISPDGLLVIAIYNKHITSPIWWQIKRLYNLSPGFIQHILVLIFMLVIGLAKYMVTKKNPFQKKKRGMSFYYDVIDWLGGFPYEYASKREIVEYMKSLGLRLIKFVPSLVPTGCNEFVFERLSSTKNKKSQKR